MNKFNDTLNELRCENKIRIRYNTCELTLYNPLNSSNMSYNGLSFDNLLYNKFDIDTKIRLSNCVGKCWIRLGQIRYKFNESFHANIIDINETCLELLSTEFYKIAKKNKDFDKVYFIRRLKCLPKKKLLVPQTKELIEMVLRDIFLKCDFYDDLNNFEHFRSTLCWIKQLKMSYLKGFINDVDVTLSQCTHNKSTANKHIELAKIIINSL